MSQAEIMKSEKCVRQHLYADVFIMLRWGRGGCGARGAFRTLANIIDGKLGSNS